MHAVSDVFACAMLEGEERKTIGRKNKKKLKKEWIVLKKNLLLVVLFQ